jgi:Fic family protein
VAAFTGELRERMPAATTLREQLELAFEAHQRLVSIHPFNDGNGRTSRLLMNYVQRRHGQPLTIVFSEDRQAYFAALEQSRVAEDLTVFFDFVRIQHGKSLT